MNNGSPYTDKDLFGRIALDDTEAFRTLFDRYREELYSVALKLTKSTLKAEEITQEAFISLWVSRARLPLVENPGNYIFKVVYNKIAAYLKSETNRERIIREAAQYSKAAGNNTEEAVDFKETNHRIEEALQLMTPQQRTAYQLRRQQGLSIEEVAQQMGISPFTVKSHLTKALDFIRKYMDDITIVTALLVSFHETARL